MKAPKDALRHAAPPLNEAPGFRNLAPPNPDSTFDGNNFHTLITSRPNESGDEQTLKGKQHTGNSSQWWQVWHKEPITGSRLE